MPKRPSHKNRRPGWNEETQMKSLPVLAKLFTTTLLLTTSANSLGGGVPIAVHYVDHDKVDATMAKGGAIVSDPGLIVLAQRRGTGPVQYHDHTNHVFIIVEGEATFVTGGTMVDAKRTAPEQMEAASIEGGETHHLTK